MKKTQFLELIKNVKGTIVSFISIFIFVAMALGFYCGLDWASLSFSSSTETVADDGVFHDISLISPYGMSDEDIEALKAIDNIDAVEASQMSYQNFTLNNRVYLAQVMTMPQEIDDFVEINGVLPTKDGEIAVDRSWANNSGVEIGDTITFSKDENSSLCLIKTLLDYKSGVDNIEAYIENFSKEYEMTYLNSKEYTVTALVISPTAIHNGESSYGIAIDSGNTINCFMYVHKDAWSEASNTGYRYINLKSDYLKQYTLLSDEYSDAVALLKNDVNDVCEEIASRKNNLIQTQIDTILSDAKAVLDDSEKQIKDGENELADAKAKIQDAENQIAAAELEIANGEIQIANGEKLIKESELRIANGKAELAEAEKLIAENEELLKSYKLEYDAKKADFDEINEAYTITVTICDHIISAIEDGSYTFEDIDSEIRSTEIISKLEKLYYKYQEDLNNMTEEEIEEYFNEFVQHYENKEYTSLRDLFNDTKAIIDPYFNDAEAQLKDAKKQIDDGEAQLKEAKALVEYNRQLIIDGEKELADGKLELINSKAALEEGKVQLTSARNELAQAKIDYANGEKELADGKEKYNEALKQYDEFSSIKDTIPEVPVILYTSMESPSMYMTKIVTNLISNVKLTLAIIFFAVGILVSYSAVSRLVNDQIIYIGTKKALGINKREITTSYLAYSGTSAIIGCLLGGVVAYFVTNLIMNVIMTLYTVSYNGVTINWISFIAVAGIEVLIIVLVAYIACGNILNRNAITLLKGHKPPEGKTRFYEKFFIWKKLSLFSKTIFNNCLNDRRRVIGTLIGIAGCTTLLVGAITFSEHIDNSIEIQNNDYYIYTHIVYFDNENESASKEISDLLDSKGYINTLVYEGKGFEQVEGEDPSTMYIVSPSNTEEYKKIHHMESMDSTEGNYEGAWMPSSFADYFNVENGFILHGTATDGTVFDVPIEGFYKHYADTHTLVLFDDTYEKIMGHAPTYNAYYFDGRNADIEALENDLSKIDGYRSLFNFQKYYTDDFSAFTSISIVIVFITILLAVVLSLLVLLNLLTMFVNEKKKELIVLLINGYDLKTTKKYISGDTVFLAIIGIIIGCVLGTLAGNWVISSIEGRYVDLIQGISWKAIIIGVIASIILTHLMSLISLRRVNKFKLKDINTF